MFGEWRKKKKEEEGRITDQKECRALFPDSRNKKKGVRSKKERRLFLTIDLTEHNIHGSDHGDNIGNKVTLSHEIQSSQVGETGGTDLAAVRTVASVRNQVHT